jgi:CheY-like chemotaxis protein
LAALNRRNAESLRRHSGDYRHQETGTGNQEGVMQYSALARDPPDIEQRRLGIANPCAAQTASKILIADDDPSILRLLADRCTRLGFLVDTAANGMQAVLKANRTKPDVLVIDVNMPEIDGLSACAHLLDKGSWPVDTIVITGSRNRDTLQRCENIGARYVRKGAAFWDDLETALADLQPRLAGKIQRLNADRGQPIVRKRPSLLLVDDDHEVSHYLSTRLTKRGIEVKHAGDAEQAYQIARSDEPAIIVTDYFMPNGDADSLLQQLRSTSATDRIPVFVLTGRRLNPVIEQNLKRPIRGNPGAEAIFVKSKNTEPLFGALQKYCAFERPC